MLAKLTKSEKKTVLLSTSLNFLNGMLQSFIGAVPLALFLAQYSTELLPMVYVWAGLFIFASGLVIIYSQRKFNYFQFFASITFFLIVSLIALWLLFIFYEKPILSIFFIIWGGVIAAFSSSLIGIFMNQLFTLQQAKRFFPFVQGASAAIGAMIIGFSLPFLTRVLHLRNVPLLLAIILALSLANIFLIRKFCSERFINIEQKKERKKESFFHFHNRTYILLLFFFIFITNSDEVAFSVLFSTEAKQQLKDAASLAGFFGVLGAICNILQSTVGLLTFKIILKKWGLFVSLLTIPITVSIWLGITFIFNFAGTSFLFFAFLTATRAIQVVLRNGFLGSSFLLLFQPLKPNERLWAQLQNRFIVTPCCVCLIGLILMGVKKLFGINFVALSLCMFGIYLITIMVLSLVKKNYTSVLKNAITKHFFVNADFTLLDAKSLEIVKKKLKSKVPEETTYALQTLENASANDFKREIVSAIDHESDDVKIYALSKIREYKLQNAEEKVKEIIKTGKNNLVISQAILALGSLQKTSDLNFVKSHIYDEDRQIAASSLIALYQYGAIEDQKECLDRLQSADGIIKATFLQEIEIDQKADLLIPLLKSEERTIRKEACRAAFNLQDERIYPLLFENTLIPNVRAASFTALLNLKKPLFEENFDQYSYEIQIERLKILGFLQDDQSIEILFKHMNHKDKKLSFEAIKSLNRLGFQARNEKEKGSIQNQIHVEKENFLLLQAHVPKAPFLEELTQREMELTQQKLYYLLSLIYPKDLIMKALEGIQTKNPDLISYSIEIFLQLLNSQEVKELLPLLTNDPYNPIEKPLREKDLIFILDHYKNFVLSSLQAASIFAIGFLNLNTLSEKVLAIDSQDPLTVEVQQWTMERMKDKG